MWRLQHGCEPYSMAGSSTKTLSCLLDTSGKALIERTESGERNRPLSNGQASPNCGLGS
jgi:hypothetical protein